MVDGSKTQLYPNPLLKLNVAVIVLPRRLPLEDAHVLQIGDGRDHIGREGQRIEHRNIVAFCLSKPQFQPHRIYSVEVGR